MESTMFAPRWETRHAVTVQTPPHIKALPWQPVSHCPGVWVKQLCDGHGVVRALISITAGASTPGHPHRPPINTSGYSPAAPRSPAIG